MRFGSEWCKVDGEVKGKAAGKSEQMKSSDKAWAVSYLCVYLFLYPWEPGCEAGTQRQSSHALVHSPDACKNQGWLAPKPGPRNAAQGSQGVERTRLPAPSPLPLRTAAAQQESEAEMKTWMRVPSVEHEC